MLLVKLRMIKCAALYMIFIISGCQYGAKPLNNNKLTNNVENKQLKQDVTPSDITPSVNRSNKVNLCKSELNSLEKISPKVFKDKQAEFNLLVSNVSVYSGVRGDVNSKTKETIDALYRYKTNLICSDIEREVLKGLVIRGESFK